jgi:L-fuconolactonase
MSAMEIVDAQVHIEEPAPAVLDEGHPFGDPDYVAAKPPNRAVSADEMVVAMREAGVDAAIVAQTSRNGWDNSYAVSACVAYPDRFAVIGLVDPGGADVRDRMEEWSAAPSSVGVRFLVVTDAIRDAMMAGGYEEFFRAAEAFALPVCIWGPNYLAETSEVIRKHPDVSFVIDHFGLGGQIPGVLTLAEMAIEDKLPWIYGLADMPNVSVKVTGGPSLCELPSPFEDLWPMFSRFIECYGVDRLMWGTDWTRVYNGTYSDAVRFIRDSERLSDDEKQALMSSTTRRIFEWP